MSEQLRKSAKAVGNEFKPTTFIERWKQSSLGRRILLILDRFL